jgi:hypothetical protein
MSTQFRPIAFPQAPFERLSFEQEEAEPVRARYVPAGYIDLDPVLPVVEDILRDLNLNGPLMAAIRVIESSALTNTTLVSAKSVPLVYFSDHSIVNIWDNEVSCRLRYAESAFMATASLVYNFVLGLCFSVGSVVAMGGDQMVQQMQKHWIHTACAVGAIVASTIGTVSPEWGIKANAAVYLALGAAGAAWIHQDVLERIPAVYRDHAEELKDAALDAVGGDQRIYNGEIEPFLRHLDNAFEGDLVSPSDYLEIGKGLLDKVPGLYPRVSKEPVLHNLEELFA